MHDAAHSSPSSPVASRGAGRRSWWGRLRDMLGGLGLGLGVSTASGLALAQAPAHWVSYAQLVGGQFQSRLSDPASDAVVRLHAWMQARLLDPAQGVPPPALLVRVWIAPDGRVGRLEFPSLGQAQADADLRSLLGVQPLSEPPPADMRQPLVLQLSLDFPAGG